MPSTSNTEKICPVCRGAGYLVKDVSPDHPDFGALYPCQCKVVELKAKRLSDLQGLSQLGELSRMTFQNFKPEGVGLNTHKRDNLRRAYDRAERFAQESVGWLILKGGYGCGKTHLAAAISNHRIANGQPVLFVVVPDLLDHLRAAYAPDGRISFDQRFEEVRGAPLLILDDLGTQSSTPWAQEKLYQILNHRYNARLPTVITTNRELEEIDLRLRSRLVDPDLSEIITILAPDFRRSGVSQDQSELSSLHHHSDKTFETFDLRSRELPGEEHENLKRACAIAKGYAENPVDWLVFTGTYGCGKTHLAAAIANYRQERGYPALFVVVPDLLDHLRATFSPQSLVSYDQRFEEVRDAALLILDDLGAQSSTIWAQEKLFQLFNHRYNARLPTIITMQESVEELEKTNPRLTSRILDFSRCTICAIIAPSYRGEVRPRKRRNYQKRG